MGWNSFDCFGSTVSENEVLANAEFLAARLLPFGWKHIVVDYCWSHPNPPAYTKQNEHPEYQPYLNRDVDFRRWPASGRFPSSANANGFHPLTEKLHRLGLTFGIHIMRGLPRQAFYSGYPAFNLKHRASEMADANDTCVWLNHMYGVRVSRPEGQDYSNSLFELYGFRKDDLVKGDDFTFLYGMAEIGCIDHARKQSGRPISLSLSPAPFGCHTGRSMLGPVPIGFPSDGFSSGGPAVRNTIPFSLLRNNNSCSRSGVSSARPSSLVETSRKWRMMCPNC
jgi:hypothetical protein